MIGIDVGSDAVRVCYQGNCKLRPLTRLVNGAEHTMTTEHLWLQITALLEELGVKKRGEISESKGHFEKKNDQGRPIRAEESDGGGIFKPSFADEAGDGGGRSSEKSVSSDDCESAHRASTGTDEKDTGSANHVHSADVDFPEKSASETAPKKDISQLSDSPEPCVFVSATCSMAVVEKIETPSGPHFAPLEDIIVWMDSRAQKQAHWVSQHLPPEVLSRVGGRVTPEMGLAKLKWVDEKYRLSGKNVVVFELYDWVSYLFAAGGVRDGLVRCVGPEAVFGPGSQAMDGLVKGWSGDVLAGLGVTVGVGALVQSPTLRGGDQQGLSAMAAKSTNQSTNQSTNSEDSDAEQLLSGEVPLNLGKEGEDVEEQKREEITEDHSPEKMPDLSPEKLPGGMDPISGDISNDALSPKLVRKEVFNTSGLHKALDETSKDATVNLSFFPYAGEPIAFNKYLGGTILHGCIDCYAGVVADSRVRSSEVPKNCSTLHMVAGTLTCFVASIPNSTEPIPGLWGPFDQLTSVPIYAFGQPATGKLFSLVLKETGFDFDVLEEMLLGAESDAKQSIVEIAKNHLYYGDRDGNRSPYGDFAMDEIFLVGDNADIHSMPLSRACLQYHLAMEFLAFQTRQLVDKLGPIDFIRVSGSQANNKRFMRLLSEFSFCGKLRPQVRLASGDATFSGAFAGYEIASGRLVGDGDVPFQAEPLQDGEREVLEKKYKFYLELSDWQHRFRQAMRS